MTRIRARSDDMLIVRGVNLFPTQIEEQLLTSEMVSGHYQIVLTREGRLDDVAVRVECRAEHFAAGGLEPEAAAIAARIKAIVGVTVRVLIEPPGTIERSLGKARRVIDLRARR